MKKAIVYINQFFGQLGGEDTAGVGPSIHEGQIGPAMAYNQELHAEVTHTIICGDNYMGSNPEDAVKQILEMLEPLEFDVFVAGPAFNAGRYGVACGTICKAVKEKFNVPVITSMNEENPGVEMFRKDVIILKGGNIASKMRKDLPAVAKVANCFLDEVPVGPADEMGYFPTGHRHQVFIEEDATSRFMKMLHARIKGEPYVSELIVPKLDRVPIAAPLKDLKNARIALLDTGGIVPVDNPDRIQSASATRWGKYDISNMDRLEGGVFKTIHAGFDPAAANADPNVIMPVDAMKALLKEGVYGSLHPYFYSTVGTGTTEKEAARMAKEIIPLLQEDHVDACIMVSTWGTCTRCGATMVKEIERTGMPVVHMCNIVPVSKTVGANRIVPTISIPYPLGDPATSKEDQWKLRYHRVKVALEALATDVKEQTVFRV